MIALLEKTAEQQAQSIPSLKFHLRIACASLVMLIVAFAGSRLTSIHIDPSGQTIALFTVFAMFAPLPIYWHQKGRVALRESVLVIAWELLAGMTVPFIVLIAARSRMPLQDSYFAHLDQMLGVSVPGIVAWAGRHWLGTAFNWTYPLLPPILTVAALAPALTGKVRHAREFLLANLIALAIGLSAFALLPAVGPWYYYHTPLEAFQINSQRMLLDLRLPGPYVAGSQAAAIVCFPSFHVVWAILSAAALWGFKLLRIPVALLSAMIVMSTLTTGWHYFSDVLAGILLAVFSLAVARAYSA